MHEQIRRSVDLAASPDRVWDAVICGAWLGEDGLIEPRTGADGWIRDGHDLRHLVVEEARPGRRLVFRWWSLGPDGVGPATRVQIDVDAEVTVEADGVQRTRVVVAEAPVAVGAPLPTNGPAALARV